MLLRTDISASASPMLPRAQFTADVVLVAPREFEITRSQRTYREKNFTTFTELLGVSAFQTDYIKRVNEALGLEALASYLRSAGIRVAIINCNVAPHTPSEVLEKVRSSSARIVGISLIYRPQVGFALELLKALESLPEVQVCVGGALASFMPRELLAALTRLNAVIYGEAEETFRDYCQMVLGLGDWRSLSGVMSKEGDALQILSGSTGNGQDWRVLKGLAYRDGDSPVLNAPAQPLDLQTVQMPARDTLTYLRAAGWSTRIASIYTSRGCMAKCTFCTGKDAYNVERLRTYRFRSALDVVDEIQYLHEAFGVKYVYINDDNFLGYGKQSYDRVRKIAEELLNRNLRIQFASECRVDGLDRDLLLLLKEAGMQQVLLGIESGSDSTLKRWRKGATVQQNRDAISMINRVGIALEPGFILFDAHTTSSELKENLDFLRQTGLYRTPIPTYLVNRLSVYPGTEVEQLLVADGTIAPSPIRLGGKTKNDPGLIVQYFQRMEYVCRDVRSEIAWRSLREALEPVEVFLESSLPALTAVLMDCRAQTDDQQIRNKVRSLIHNAANWRRRVGELVLRFIARCVDSYEICGHPAQWRWLRSKLAEDRNAFAQETLGVSMQAFQENIARLRRGLVLADVSVIIPTAGKWSRLSRTLASLARQRINPDLRWDVIVVADGVTPPSDLNLWTDHLPLRIVQLPGPHGRGATRNAGIAHSRAEVIVLLDDDIVVSPDFVQQHWDAQCRQASLCHGPIRELTGLAYFEDLDELAFSPGMGPHTSPERMKSWATRVLSQLEDTELCWENFGTPSRLERDGVEALYERRMAAAWVGFAGANISAPRKWFLEDGFDESTGTRWGLEDISLALRWTLAGKPLTVAAGARGLHLSHRRGDWKRDHQANAACLSFLPKETVPSVFDYLEGRIEIRDLENSLQSSFHSGTRPSASPFQAAQMEVAVDVNVS